MIVNADSSWIDNPEIQSRIWNHNNFILLYHITLKLTLKFITLRFFITILSLKTYDLTLVTFQIYSNNITTLFSRHYD